MNLKDYLNDSRIEPIPISFAGAMQKLKKAIKFLHFAKKHNEKGFEDVVYTKVYDASRIACDALLLIKGYRVKKSSEAHHYIIINVANELLPGRLTHEFKRIQKMRSKRNKLEYGTLDNVSEQELKQAINDTEKLIKEVDKKIKVRQGQQKLI